MLLELVALLLIGPIIGYVASIFTWPEIRTWMTGAENEIERTKDRLAALRTKARGK